MNEKTAIESTSFITNVNGGVISFIWNDFDISPAEIFTLTDSCHLTLGRDLLSPHKKHFFDVTEP